MRMGAFLGILSATVFLIVGLATAVRSWEEPKDKQDPQPALHSLEPLPVLPPKNTGSNLVLSRPEGGTLDPIFRVLGEAPREPVGERMKPAPPRKGPIEVVRVLKNGDVLFGENAGLRRQPTGPAKSPRSDPGQSSPIDFWWDAQNRKLHVRSLLITENGDAPEIGLRRSGDGTYPNGPPLPSRKGDNLGLIHWMGWSKEKGFNDRSAQIFVRAAEDITAHGAGGNLYLATTPKGSTAAPLARVIISSEGQVGIDVTDPQARLHVMGPNIAGLAEDYFSREPLQAGDVVVLDDAAKDLRVKKSSRPYDAKMLGVVAANPAVRISTDQGPPNRKHRAAAANAYPVAVAGRVRIKVSAENGPIQAGDYLTSSTITGVAMKATRKGPVLGKALQPHTKEGVATIWMLAAPGWYNP